ncbi:SprT family zinc-dependent metalloprotease [Halocynthiibacter sp. C4]|uniref:M48 family metallopeptidase n=1 Tax=Halocynthiibacter sp. C4 TaxID=2992758 RepID=UPI00237C3874|nr:SprT family zinc-dependent metalloprotease [Halocynthiibacter sp. C4]MDE0590397.1 SprT family zinc-dependent metalloprotease [Halocynthiibacter sp. C4]
MFNKRVQVDSLRLSGTPEVVVKLRRSARAKRLSLRVSRLDGRVTLTLPTRARVKEAERFANEKADWIRAQLGTQVEQIRPAPGSWVWFRGQRLEIAEGTGRSARLVGGRLEVSEERAGVKVATFLKHAARADLLEASEGYAHDLGVDIGKITLRDTRSRWGSCSYEGNLMYSWRLVMAPPDVLRYVAAHEVAHRVEMNHSQAFWDQVARIYPDYAAPRKWLRDEGQELHRFRFKD